MPLTRHIPAIPIALSAILAIGACNAGGLRDIDSLTPFRAQYQAKFDIGLDLGGDATRQLSQTSNGNWLLAQDATALIAAIHERSEFSSRDDQLIPLRYEYQRKVLGKQRHALLTFDWADYSVINDVQDQPWQMPITTGTLDKLNYQLQLRLDLLNGKEHLHYLVADGGRIKTYRFQVVAEEVLQTPIGSLQTVVVKRLRDENDKRETLIWFARQFDHLIVKLSQIEKNGKEFSLIIESLATEKKE